MNGRKKMHSSMPWYFWLPSNVILINTYVVHFFGRPLVFCTIVLRYTHVAPNWLQNAFFLLYLLHKIKMICHRIFDTNLKRCVWSTVLLYTHLLSTAQTITLKMMMLKKSISFCVYFSASRVDREAPWSRGCWRSRRLFPLPSIRSSRTNNHMEKTCG